MLNILFRLVPVLFVFFNFIYGEEQTLTYPFTICSQTECYTVLGKLGEGAFGKVYEIQDSSGQHLALKAYKIPEDQRLADHPWSNAEREYKIGKSLNHVNIVKIVDLFYDQSDFYQTTGCLIMEMIEGTTMREIEKKSLDHSQVQRAILQALDALRYALAHEMIHLDLHGANIMLANPLDVKIIDLASFYTFNELFNYATSENKTEKILLPPTPRSSSKPVNDIKIQRFFMQNPKLLEKVKVAAKKIKKKEKLAKGIWMNSIGVGKNNRLQIRSEMLPLLSYYLDSITEMCIEFLYKTDYSREEKLQRRVAFKLLAWNYYEDAEEGLLVPIDDYFDQLIRLLR